MLSGIFRVCFEFGLCKGQQFSGAQDLHFGVPGSPSMTKVRWLG